MRVLDRLQETWQRVTGRTEVAALNDALGVEQRMVGHLQESIADLESRMYEPGWQRMTSLADQEFTREGLRQITAVCRIMAIKNPLIKRGLALRASYVWGQGVEITARDPKVNDVVAQFLDDNKATFTGAQAREEMERALGTDGNVFVACFTAPSTGRVRVRTLPYDEITHIVTNPEDRAEPWFYRREWWAERVEPVSGGVITERKSAYYPALGYRPAVRRRLMNFSIYGDSAAAPVYWDAPVYHVRVGGHLHWKWGLGDCYAAVDWARAYKDFLSDWATLVKSLSRFAWNLTTKGSKQAAAKQRLAAAPSVDSRTGEPQHAGATAMTTPDMVLEAIPKSGATIDSESGRPLAAMVATALDLPVTMLLGDPGVTGARATAETLDTPTERAMQARQQLWSDAQNAILQYVVAESVRAPQGVLKGTITRDDADQETVRMRGRRDTTIDISWPDLDEVDVATVVEAITKADLTGHLPPLVIARLLLEALGVSDVDEILDRLTGPDGEFVSPTVTAGQAAVDAFRQGKDPAALLAGDQEPPTSGNEDPAGRTSSGQG